MMSGLENFDKVVAAGILARAALSLAYATSPVTPAIAGEDKVRASIIESARNQLGIKPDDYGAVAIEKLADFLDAESDKLIGPADEDSALKRLAERGDLPSDLYKIGIIDNVKKLYGKGFLLEKKIIETAIHAPTVEQHFGSLRGSNEPTMVSLFAKYFRTQWPTKDFIMLVAAQRDGIALNVNQAWRIYTSRVDLNGAKEPLDWLRRFTETYGAEIEVNGKRNKFFYFAQITSPLQKKAEVGGKGKPRQIIISDFTRWESGKEVASLITAIDADKYRATLKALGVRQDEILEPLV